MRFYSKQHKHYCGVDLHQKNFKSNPAAFMKAIEKCRDDIVVSAECMFTWYWLADLCESEMHI